MGRAGGFDELDLHPPGRPRCSTTTAVTFGSARMRRTLERLAFIPGPTPASRRATGWPVAAARSARRATFGSRSAHPSCEETRACRLRTTSRRSGSGHPGTQPTREGARYQAGTYVRRCVPMSRPAAHDPTGGSLLCLLPDRLGGRPPKGPPAGVDGGHARTDPYPRGARESVTDQWLTPTPVQ